MRSFLILAAAVLLSGAWPGRASTQAPEHSWDTYANPKFGYTICWPKDLLKAGPVATVGDGREFGGTHGVIMRAYGAYRADETSETFVSRVADAAKYLGGQGSKITYLQQGKDWVVASGTGKDTIFYTKIFLRKDTWKTFEIVYPQNEAATYNPVTAHIAGCFFNGQGEDEDR